MVSRRAFIKGVVGAAAAAGAASTGLVAAESLFAYPKPGIKLEEGPLIYTADDKAKELNVWYLERIGKEVFAQHFDELGKGAQVLWNGLPAVLVKLDRRKSLNFQGATTVANKSKGKVYRVVPGTPGIVDDILGLWGRCPHACCFPNWRISRPDVKNSLWCICHNSEYDPHALVFDKDPNGVEYRAALWQDGPAGRGMVQLPLRKEESGKLIGVPENVEWYRYCGVNVEVPKKE